jgi:Reverse transcriptase (RNA-dependent DNA polymerase)
LGCFIKGLCFNSFVYADDICLLAISIQHLQKLVNICNDYLDQNDLSLNSAKCKCLRIGLRNRAPCKNIRLGGGELVWVDEIKYLGVVIERIKVFRCNYSENRKKIRSFNCIYGNVGKAVINVIISLLSAQCVPTLVYGCVAIRLSKYERNRLCNSYDHRIRL